MEGSLLSLIPFILVIPLSIIIKQVEPGLFVALIVGSYIKTPNLLEGINTMVSYLIKSFVDFNNIRVTIFLYVFTGLIGIIKFAGGIKGFVHLVSKKVKDKRTAMFLTWFSTIGTFSAPDFRVVTIAPIMKALKRRLNVPSYEVGFAIEATSNPVVVLIPIATAFAGYMVATIAAALKNVGVSAQPFTVYVKSIPFNFFSFAMIVVGIYYSFFKHSKVPEGKAEEENSNKGQEEEDLNECYKAYDKDTPVRPWNLIIPLIIFIILSFFLSYWDGRLKASSFFGAFMSSDALGVMLQSLFITLILTLIFFLLQKFKLSELVVHFLKGGNELMSVIIMLALILALSSLSEDLGFSKYITFHVKSWIPHFFVAPTLFLLGSLISYFIGSSLGTWGLLMPLGITLAHETGANILPVIGAVFASGTFGGFASPLSDTTVTLCTILNLPVMKYTRWKLIPALVAAGIATVLFAIVPFFIR